MIKKELFCMNYIGNFIKKYRGDMSLREFAEKCDISHTHLDSIEKGYDPRTGKPVRVTVDTLKKIASAMNMSVNDLLIQSGDVKIEELNFDNATFNKIENKITKIPVLGVIKAGTPIEAQEDIIE
jgi:transcriptional regulator with XRE-family HTH domain